MEKKIDNNNNCIGPNGRRRRWRTFFIQIWNKIISFKCLSMHAILNEQTWTFQWNSISNHSNVSMRRYKENKKIFMLRDVILYEWLTKLRFLHFAYVLFGFSQFSNWFSLSLLYVCPRFICLTNIYYFSMDHLAFIRLNHMQKKKQNAIFSTQKSLRNPRIYFSHAHFIDKSIWLFMQP